MPGNRGSHSIKVNIGGAPPVNREKAKARRMKERKKKEAAQRKIEKMWRLT